MYSHWDHRGAKSQQLFMARCSRSGKQSLTSGGFKCQGCCWQGRGLCYTAVSTSLTPGMLLESSHLQAANTPMLFQQQTIAPQTCQGKILAPTAGLGARLPHPPRTPRFSGPSPASPGGAGAAPAEPGRRTGGCRGLPRPGGCPPHLSGGAPRRAPRPGGGVPGGCAAPRSPLLTGPPEEAAAPAT